MDLTAAQQERYSRHLILPGWSGEGQEALLAASVRVRGQGRAALWAARYLAAAGVGHLVVDTEEIYTECRLLNADCRASLASEGTRVDASVDASEGGPFEGARAALEAVRGLLP